MSEHDYHDWDHFIDGSFTPGAADGRLEVENPATKEIVGSAPDGTAEDVDAAVEAAKCAYEETWRHVPARERVGYLLEVAD